MMRDCGAPVEELGAQHPDTCGPRALMLAYVGSQRSPNSRLGSQSTHCHLLMPMLASAVSCEPLTSQCAAADSEDPDQWASGPNS